MPMVRFLDDYFAGSDCREEEGEEGLIRALHSIVLAEPRLEEPEEQVYRRAFLARQRSALPQSPKTERLLADMLKVRRLEHALLLVLVLSERLETVMGAGWTVGKQVTEMADALSVHYAVDMKPTAGLLKYIKKAVRRAAEEGDTKGTRLLRRVVDACGLDDGSAASDDEEETGRASAVEDVVESTQPVLIPSQSQTRLSSLHSQSQQLTSQSQGQQQQCMSPLTLNSHWSRLRSKTLRRRSTDTDLSRLVDLPSTTQASQSTVGGARPSLPTPKRKGVLVRVGDISPTRHQTISAHEVMAWETPVKKRRAPSTTLGGSQSQTQYSETTTLGTGSLLLVLETPPRPSLGAATSRIEGTTVKPLNL